MKKKKIFPVNCFWVSEEICLSRTRIYCMNIKPPQLTLQLRPWSLLLQAKEKYSIFKKYRTFSVLIYSYIQVEIGKTRNCVETRRPQGGVFSHNFEFFQFSRVLIFKKYKTFSVLIYSYINTSGNWKNEKLCGNTTPAGRSVFTQFRIFPIFTSVDITVYQYGKNVLYFFYNIAQRTLTEEWREIFRVDIELYQHGS